MGYQIHFNLILGHHWFLITTYGLMDMIDPDQFIDVGLFLKSAVQISDAWFEYQYKKNQDGKNFDLKSIIKKWNISIQEPYATQISQNQYIL